MSGTKAHVLKAKAEAVARAARAAEIAANRAAVREKLTAFLCGLLGWESLDAEADAAISAAMSGQTVDLAALEDYLTNWAANRAAETEAANVQPNE